MNVNYIGYFRQENKIPCLRRDLSLQENRSAASVDIGKFPCYNTGTYGARESGRGFLHESSGRTEKEKPCAARYYLFSFLTEAGLFRFVECI